MLAKRIIPCLDVDRGRVVKGIRFVSLVDAGDPVAQAKTYDARLKLIPRDAVIIAGAQTMAIQY